MTANQFLLWVGVPSLFAVAFLVWEWHSKRRVRLEEQSPLTVDGPDHVPPPYKLTADRHRGRARCGAVRGGSDDHPACLGMKWNGRFGSAARAAGQAAI